MNNIKDTYPISNDTNFGSPWGPYVSDNLQTGATICRQLREILPSLDFSSFSFIHSIFPIFLVFCMADMLLRLTFRFILGSAYRYYSTSNESSDYTKIEINQFMQEAFPEHGVNRIISAAHAIVALNWSVLVILCEYGTNEIGGEISDRQRWCLAHSVGYFLYDAIYSAYALEWDSLVHHIISLLSMSYGLYHNVSGTEFIYGLAVAELVTPVLHLRYFLRFYSKRSTKRQNQQKFIGHGKLQADGNTAVIENRNKIGREEQHERAVYNEMIIIKDPKSVTNYSISTTDVDFSCENVNTGNSTLVKLYIHITAILVVMFMIMRGIVAPVIVYKTVVSIRTHILIKFCAFAIQLVSMFWIATIFKVTLRRKKQKLH